MVPGATIEALKNPDNYTIQLDQDNSDYILSSSRLASLEGTLMGKVRRKVNKFSHEYEGRIKLIELDLARYENKKLIINSTHLWNHVYTHNDQERAEGIALDRALRLAEVVDFKCLALFIDGSLQGYCIFRILPQSGWASMPHTKISNNQPFAFDFLVHKAAKLLHDKNIKYINFEQDLGLPGLRQHKQDLRPLGQLFKYTVTPKNT
jgi:hypothetical protein